MGGDSDRYFRLCKRQWPNFVLKAGNEICTGPFSCHFRARDGKLKRGVDLASKPPCHRLGYRSAVVITSGQPFIRSTCSIHNDQPNADITGSREQGAERRAEGGLDMLARAIPRPGDGWNALC